MQEKTSAESGRVDGRQPGCQPCRRIIDCCSALRVRTAPYQDSIFLSIRHVGYMSIRDSTYILRYVRRADRYEGTEKTQALTNIYIYDIIYIRYIYYM